MSQHAKYQASQKSFHQTEEERQKYETISKNRGKQAKHPQNGVGFIFHRNFPYQKWDDLGCWDVHQITQTLPICCDWSISNDRRFGTTWFTPPKKKKLKKLICPVKNSVWKMIQCLLKWFLGKCVFIGGMVIHLLGWRTESMEALLSNTSHHTRWV